MILLRHSPLLKCSLLTSAGLTFLIFKSLHKSTLSMKPTMTIADTTGTLPRGPHIPFTISLFSKPSFPSKTCI